ncbi:unnamed protein product [Cuscuta campestris]|uniref:Uncharacterized protein n=1 Tax=Cuscuta campestris TaxID=132261 RepID=A0A484KQI8_9ASTE|nr:unnamed protein product [Cuscuta campestris]
MSLFTTQSPTGVAITSSGSKKGDLFVADLNIKSKKITTDIKVDSNSNIIMVTTTSRIEGLYSPDSMLDVIEGTNN